MEKEDLIGGMVVGVGMSHGTIETITIRAEDDKIYELDAGYYGIKSIRVR